MKKLILLVSIALLGALVGCVPDERPDREFDAPAAIREVFSMKMRGDGSLFEEARVTSVTPAGVEWGEKRRLAWSDLDDIEAQTDQEKPAHPETLYLYLKRGAPSVETARAERPPLSGKEITRCYVPLHDRAPGSRAKLVRALRVFGREAKAAEPPPPQQPPAPPRTTEERLARLKELHEKGLITDEVYKEEQRKVLAGGY